MLEGCVNYAIRRGSCLPQAVQIIERTAMHFDARGGEGGGRGIRASQARNVVVRVDFIALMSAAVIKYDPGVGRWEPNAQGRLEQAAMELYLERGFEQTTVADIASRAGLTERTFFRHFTDKREVLFSGSASLQDRLVSAIANAPDTLAPMDAVAVGLEAIAIVLLDRRGREFAQQRQAVVAANDELRERELIKMAALAAATADALRQRGVKEPAASLIAEAGIAVFRVAFERWVRGKKPRDLSRLIQESLSELKLVVAAG